MDKGCGDVGRYRPMGSPSAVEKKQSDGGIRPRVPVGSWVEKGEGQSGSSKLVQQQQGGHAPPLYADVFGSRWSLPLHFAHCTSISVHCADACNLPALAFPVVQLSSRPCPLLLSCSRLSAACVQQLPIILMALHYYPPSPGAASCPLCSDISHCHSPPALADSLKQ